VSVDFPKVSSFISIINVKMKTFKYLSIFLGLAVMLSSCNLPGISALPTQTIDQNLAGTTTAKPSQVDPTQTQLAMVTFTNTAPMATTPTTATQIPPNTPVWIAYRYTCEIVSGGSNMTMSLTWADRSDSEENYIVYRNKQAIATLPPNSASYVDTAFVAPGKTLSYSVEAFNKDWQTSTSTITYGCQ
jgi:hypothetical protein